MVLAEPVDAHVVMKCGPSSVYLSAIRIPLAPLVPVATMKPAHPIGPSFATRLERVFKAHVIGHVVVLVA